MYRPHCAWLISLSAMICTSFYNRMTSRTLSFGMVHQNVTMRQPGSTVTTEPSPSLGLLFVRCGYQKLSRFLLVPSSLVLWAVPLTDVKLSIEVKFGKLEGKQTNWRLGVSPCCHYFLLFETLNLTMILHTHTHEQFRIFSLLHFQVQSQKMKNHDDGT